jgi:hypothetical protein
VFAAIERAIGDGISASVSYVAFSLDHHIAREAVSPPNHDVHGGAPLQAHMIIEVKPCPEPASLNVSDVSN